MSARQAGYPLTLDDTMTAATLPHRGRRWHFACRPPDPVRSAAEYRRFVHADLIDLNDEQLWRECERARLRLILDDDPHPWYVERWRRCQAEQASRRGAA